MMRFFREYLRENEKCREGVVVCSYGGPMVEFFDKKNTESVP